MLELYLHALETHGEAFVEVLRKIADCEKAVLFHCTAGKDRTGLIAALLLSLSGVNRDDIIQDYAMTAMRIGPLLQNIEKTAAALKLDKVDFAPMLECKPETMQKTLEWLDDKFDGSENYVREHGLTDRELQLLRGRWLAS